MVENKTLADKIYGIYSACNNITIKYSLPLFIIYALVTISIVVWSLNRGLGFYDEAWYLMHLKNFAQGSSSEWHSYAKLIFPEDLLSIRYYTFSGLILSGIVITLGFISYYRQFSILTLLPITISGLFLFGAPVQIVPSYITFNIFIFNTGIGFYLFMLSGKTILKKYIWGVLTGFIFGKLFFIFITNSPYIFFLFVLILFMKQHRKYMKHYWIALTVGIFLSVIFFFVMIKSFSDYMNDFTIAFSRFSASETHNTSMIKRWLFSTISYFSFNVILPSFILFFIMIANNLSKTNRFLALSFFTIYFVHPVIINFFFDNLNINTPTPIYILSVFILLMFIEKGDWQNTIVIVLLLLIPIFASFGSDVRFVVRSALYLTPLILLISIMVKHEPFKKITLIFHGIFLSALILFSTDYLSTPGWGGYIIKDQKIKLESIGIDVAIKLDKNKIEEIEELKSLIPSHSSVIINDIKYWGYVYLLDLNVPYYYFRFSEAEWKNYYFSNRINVPSTLYMIEDTSKPFSDFVMKNPDICMIDTIPLKKIKNTNLYRITYKQYIHAN